jgi:hypothetical protein
MGSSRSQRISELNESHPLNRLALERLEGYGVDEDGELAALALIEAWWDELQGSKLFKMKGGPRAGEVESAFESLFAADPDAVMSYLTEVAGEAALDIGQLRELDGDQIAHAVLKVVILQLVHGEPLPKPN